MKIMNQFVISALVLVPFGIPAMLYSAAENTPVEQRSCEIFTDVDFSGYDITVRSCRAYGVEVSHQVWRNKDARLVCVTDDPIRRYLYADEESDFDVVQCESVWTKDDWTPIK